MSYILYQIIKDNLSLMACMVVADMNPMTGGVGQFLLPDQLVEMEMIHHPEEPFLAGGFVGRKNVGSLASQVLGGGGTAHVRVEIELRAAVARADDDGLIGMLPQRFQYFLAQ